jgi:integrase/recombinase XerD
MENFLEYLNNTYMSENTIKTYYSTARYFIESFNTKDLMKITRSDILIYKKHLEQKGYKGKTISTYLEGLRVYFKYLFYFEDIITPITNVRNNKPFIDAIPRMNFEPKLNYNLELTTHEVNRIRLKIQEHKDFRTLLIFELMIDTGLRIHEVLKIKRADILKKEIEIQGKGGKYRHIYPAGRIRTIAKEYLKTARAGEMLFTGYKNSPLSKSLINKILKEYAIQAKVSKDKAFPHNFRHFFTITEVKRGTPLNLLSLKLGIKDTKILAIYQARNLTN